MNAHAEPDSRRSLSWVQNEVERFELNPRAREATQAHCRNLERLAASLSRLGLDDTQIEGHVMHVFDGYRQVLLSQFDHLRKVEPTGKDAASSGAAH